MRNSLQGRRGKRATAHHHSRKRGHGKEEWARLIFGAWIEEAYAALKMMVQDEEAYAALKQRTDSGDMVLIGIPEETNMAYDAAEEWYIGTTGEGAERATLSKCGERTAKDKAEDPIASTESKVWRFQAPQPETREIGE